MKTQPVSHEIPQETIWQMKDKLTVSCLRCSAELTDYRPTRFTFLPYGISRAHAMLVCPKCGHVEFLSKESPLLLELEAIASDGGDDD
jgi:predicted nucleic-acid-binding Zn-ribbon protein